MLDLQLIGQYVPGTSFLHRLDPRTKLVGVIAYSVLIFFLRDAVGIGLAFALAAAAVAAGRLSPALLLRGLQPVLVLLVLTVALNAVLTPGQPLGRLGPVTVTREGLALSALMAARLVLLVVVASLLTLTTTPIALTDGVERLLRPLSRVGVPAAELALMMTIALRFIPTLMEEAQRILKAQEARGARLRAQGPLRQVQALLPILVPLFVAAFRRADELAVAMEARGYRGGQGRTRMRELAFGPADAVAAALLAAWAGAVIAWRWWGS
ncbi:energy-coupling factor transporter transmembrane component T family protein [Caldinitratiruptor microaerophilus]|uniref:Cobalt transporter n=1 Tax=Caldinitratiruptor microaerophilus TaxID=671077 RepID=A0AA35GA87_9FIRM|nr:energy-coupling factor transporter transmembrane protein EcfT [Caldinitratiruptor microaerophilus]BDG62253.1 cobalt transporter [Caldinitratiruptor microaerophilus]